jgi:arylsulfatase A-like enzyme
MTSGRKRPSILAGALLALALGACGGGGDSAPTTSSPPSSPTPPPGPPNVVLIFADDLGWGDLSSFGHPLIRTPHIDSLAEEGVRLTSFSTPTSVCAPSRAAILTGRYPIRVGVPWNPPERLNPGELTIADLLRSAGYVTAMIGKWHLGWIPPDMPIHHGFDTFYGRIRYQGDMIEGDQITDGVPLDLLTREYTGRAVQIIHENRERPFFLYLAYNAPHSPYLPSDAFAGTSPAGVYGDVVEELDWGVGQVLQALSDTGVEQNTIVLFTSDNGPDVPPGSAGPFWGGKGWPSEGGVRVPALVRWPARIPAGRVIDEITSTLDVLPTFVSAAGAALPGDRSYDGVDLTALLAGGVERLYGNGIDQGRELLYWRGVSAAAIRSGRWKYLVPGFWRSEPGLYDLETDPGERRNLLAAEPEIAERLINRMDEIIKAW